MRSMPAEVFDAARLAAVHATDLLDTGADEAFDRLSRLAATLLDAPLAFVTIVDERRSFWKSCIGVEATDPTERQNAVEQSFCQYVVGAAAPLIVGDAAADPRTAGNPSIELMGVAAWAGFPVHSPDGHVLGTFCVVDTKVREWSARDVQVLETLSHAVSGEIALRAALEDARRAGRQALELAEANAELARTLQESLLPPHLPVVPGLDLAARYLPGGRGVAVIGDFYDVFPTRGRNWGLVLGDVSGHGARAATVAGLARHTARTLAVSVTSPARILGGLNHAMLTRGGGEEEERFLSAVYAALRPHADGGFSVTLANAGHTPTLLRRVDGTLSVVGKIGMLLGCTDRPDLRNVTFRLGPGDVLVLYTDGVTEARRDGDQFGDERLADLVRAPVSTAATLAGRIESAVLAHTGGTVADDTAVLVLRVPAAQPDGLVRP